MARHLSSNQSDKNIVITANKTQMIQDMQQNKWLKFSKTNHHNPIKLFCFPFAGAGAATFTSWQNDVAPHIQVIAVQLPGRENRFSEPPMGKMSELLDVLSQHISPYSAQPWAVFGHSMGATIGYALISRLIETGCNPPQHFFTSAKSPPHCLPSHAPLSHLSDNEFLDTLATRYGADTSTSQRELLELMLPTLRADFGLIESQYNHSTIPLNTDITALYGTQDHAVSEQQMMQWSRYTNQSFDIVEINGPHFYLQSAKQQIMSIINHRL